MILLDLDDFCEGNDQWDLLWWLQGAIPRFRVTLFTIPGRCSDRFLAEMRAHSWIDMVPHGFMHQTSRECQDWTYEKTMTYLDWVERFDLTRGFKAPGWQISDGTYRALESRGYWVADQEYNNGRRPASMRTYLLNPEQGLVKIHGHVGHMGGHNVNELRLILPQILCFRNQEFGFIRDHV